MPLYTWRHRTTQDELDVLREVEQRDSPPTSNEVEEQWGSTYFPSDAPPRAEDWERVVGRGIRTTKGASWGPGKGAW